MAALSGITAVRTTSTTILRNVAYGATVAAGNPLYLDTTDSKYKLADSDLSAAAAAAKGVAITPGVNAGNGLLAIGGAIILVGTTMVVGKTYYVGPTAGEIIPAEDLATGHNVTRLGTAATTTQLNLSIEATGITHA
jgi:hypothetical protein